MIFCRDWWTLTKPGYITMTRKQSNTQRSGVIAAHTAPKNAECKNPNEKFSPRFFGIKTASSLLIIFQRVKLSTRSIAYLCWNNWRTLWRKNAAGSSQRLVLARQCPVHRALATDKKLAYLGFQCHDHSPYSPDLTRRTTTCSLDWKEKKTEKSPFFVRRVGYCCRGDLVGRPTFWNFFEWLAKVRATG